MFILEICNNQTFKNIHESAKINPVLAAMQSRYAYRYARDVLKGPFPEGESIIATDAFHSYDYAKNVLQGPFPLGEPAIAKNAMFSIVEFSKLLATKYPIVIVKAIPNSTFLNKVAIPLMSIFSFSSLDIVL